ncbi:MAG: hypothetical protein M3O41_14340 [Pseudomonadota bacterium]|nr:hypothetical protein [Pseudomonadota bacterium]
MARVRPEFPEWENPIEAIFQTLGLASVCWSRPDLAGVFDTQQCTEAALNLIDYLKEHPIDWSPRDASAHDEF